MQPVTPDRFVSHREKRDRDRVMSAVRKRILERKLRPRDISYGHRQMPLVVRERILREEYDEFSLRRAYLIADSVGVDIDFDAR